VLAGSATLAADHLTENLTTIDISHQVGERPVDYGDLESGPVTILVMGSDKRSGQGNTGYGDFEGARSDTTMLVHIYPDRDSAVVLSIPRDTVTDLPSCKTAQGKTMAPIRERFNAAFDRGGPGCTLKAVEKLTGLRVDHFVVLDFNGFKKTIDALGGVQVCLTRPLQDRQSGVDLPAGRTRVSGEQALGFVRVRHNIGDGSDLGRINRQQLFLSSLIQEVTSSGLLKDPLRMWRVLRESSKSVATDKAMADTKAILALATSLVGMRPDDITFVTLPWVWNPADPNTVVIDRARADPILAALESDSPWPPPSTPGVDGKPLKAAPGTVTVAIRNATGVQGRATAAAAKLSPQGFQIARLSSDGVARKATTIHYASDHLQAARTLQAAVPGSRLVMDQGVGDTLVLVLGRAYEGVETVRVKGAKAASGSPEVATADQNICTG
jgi:LCP family protein required for cell wall assembly